LIIAPPVIQCENDTLLEDAELSRLLSDLATSDPAFESSLSAEGCNGRVGILAEALLTTALQVSAREAVARLLRVSIFPRILGMSRGQDAWDMEMRELCLFKKVHGHVLVPQRCTRAGCKLGLWVKWVRGAYKRGVLSNIQVELLHGLGFVWDVPAHLWETGRTKLEKYSHDHRHVLVPHNMRLLTALNLAFGSAKNARQSPKASLARSKSKALTTWGLFGMFLITCGSKASTGCKSTKQSTAMYLCLRIMSLLTVLNLGFGLTTDAWQSPEATFLRSTGKALMTWDLCGMFLVTGGSKASAG